ncbi:hypothetical protein ACFLTD_04195, partial [Elusimicrobiota bacterium]
SLFFMIVYSSIITAFSTLFLSRDNNFLFATPLNWGGVLIVKFVQTVFYSSWMSIIILLPLFAVLQLIYRFSLISYAVIVPGLLFYFFNAAALGLILVLGIVKIFPARKMRDLFFMGFIVLGTSLYLLFRFLNLEQILRPGQESIATSYLKILELPKTPFLPSYWISRLIIVVINNRSGWYVPVFMLLSGAVIFVLLYYFFAKKSFYGSWEKVQCEEKKRFYKKKFPKNPIIAKDYYTFFRDTRQWTQVILIIALIVIYIVNIYKLPLDFPYLHYFVAFANIGMVGAVAAAVGLRFSFSSISLEGRYFWLLLASPIDRRKFLMSKYIENIIPILFMSMILVVVSNLILKPPPLIYIMSVSTVLVSSITLTSLGVGMGAMYPKFDAVSPAEIESSWGAILYMIFSFFYVGITLALEAVWVRMYFFNRMKYVSIYYPAVITVLCALLLINILANFIPLKMGLKNLESIEFTA